MRNPLFNFSNQRVVVMGLGLHGGGIAVTKWLIRHGARPIVTDIKTREQLQPAVAQFSVAERRAITFVLGKHRQKDFAAADLVIKNPLVPRDSKFLVLAKNHGARIENDATLFLKYCKARVVAVTGTRGKSTTSAMIAACLSASKKFRKIWLVGQSQHPELADIDRMQSNDVAVVELSSWQLELADALCPAPDVAVVTNLYPDHLNTYSGMKEYGAAKQNIFTFQKPGQTLIINRDISATRAMGQLAPSQRWWFSSRPFAEENGGFIHNNWLCVRKNGITKKVIAVKNLSLFGEHNQLNALAAATVAMTLGVAPAHIASALRRVAGLPGRFQTIRVVNEVTYINDTTATSPDGVIAALRAVGKKYRRTVLIAGGASKHIPDADYLRLAREIKKQRATVIIFSGAGSDQLRRQLKKVGVVPAADYLTRMSDAVGVAAALARTGACVLLSPGYASFGLFINEFDRGDQFNAAVGSL